MRCLASELLRVARRAFVTELAKPKVFTLYAAFPPFWTAALYFLAAFIALAFAL
jgi:hypothetical protein